MLQEAYACMHDRPMTKRAHILPILEKGHMLPLTSMVKRHHVTACNQLGSSVRLPTLLPTLWRCCQHWHIQPCWCVHIGTCVCQGSVRPGTLVEACRVKHILTTSRGFTKYKQVTRGSKQFPPGRHGTTKAKQENNGSSTC